VGGTSDWHLGPKLVSHETGDEGDEHEELTGHSTDLELLVV
jgi:hypothetical protein